MGQKSKLATDQQVQLVLRLLSKEATTVKFVRRAGMSEQTSYRWRKELIAGDKRGVEHPGTISMDRSNISIFGSFEFVNPKTILQTICMATPGYAAFKPTFLSRQILTGGKYSTIIFA